MMLNKRLPRFAESTVSRRTFSAGLVAGASLINSRVARSQSSNAGQLDTDAQGYVLDAAALELLHWWRTPDEVTRAYVGGSDAQMHVRLAQPDRPRMRPLIVLHDAGLSGRVWNHALPFMAEDRAVLAPDLPAHGDSDGDPLTSTSGHAAAVMRLADAAGLGRFDVVGEGLGAHVAIVLAAMAPSRVGRVAVSNLDRMGRAAPAPDPSDPEDTEFLSAAWQDFTSDYETGTPIGLRDRDFADLLRSRAAPPRNNGALDLKAVLDDDRVRILPEGEHGRASLQPEAWVTLVKETLDDAASRDDAQTATLPDPAPPIGSVVRRFMDTPGGQMHYRIIQGETEAPPLLCFHMSPRSSAYYEPMMSALAVAGRTVIAVDTAGYGESFKPGAWLNVPGYGAHMANFIDALGAPQVDLMGDHTGSKIAIATTQHRPDKVRRIVMNTAGVYSVEEQKGWQQRMSSIEVADDGSHFAALWERYHRLNRGKLDANQNAFRFYETVRAGPCMWWGSRAANLYILGEILPTIEHEILLICSDEDSLIEPTRRGAQILRNGRYVEFKGQGNSMVEYRVAAAAPTISQFLAE